MSFTDPRLDTMTDLRPPRRGRWRVERSRWLGWLVRNPDGAVVVGGLPWERALATATMLAGGGWREGDGECS